MNPAEYDEKEWANQPKVRFEVDRPGLSLALAKITKLKVGHSGKDFEQFERNIFEEIRDKITLDDIKDDPIFRSYRDLYWTFGMDPTKLRVSSEAVVRRIVKGNNLWRISDIVDVVNLASAYHKLPIGLADQVKIKGDLVVRSAHKGEVFQRIGGSEIICRGREIVVADNEKIVCFGYATHDSNLTKVTSNTSDVLLTIFGAPNVKDSLLESAMNRTLEMVDRWLTCRIEGTFVIHTT